MPLFKKNHDQRTNDVPPTTMANSGNTSSMAGGPGMAPGDPNYNPSDPIYNPPGGAGTGNGQGTNNTSGWGNDPHNAIDQQRAGDYDQGWASGGYHGGGAGAGTGGAGMMGGQQQQNIPPTAALGPGGQQAPVHSGHATTGKIEHAVGTMIGSKSLKAKGLQKEQEAQAYKVQGAELGEAERLEREALMRRERAVAHGAHPDHRHLGGVAPGTGGGAGF
ncbi:hypothetical protein HWV62_23532 [Athelia sp. TMB]|nr:hypothetical protein HWV62_23532 [Athelia sp. TMB]